jgi:hypothetical protein
MILQRGMALRISEEKELNRPGQFIRKINGAGLAILPSFNKGNIQTEIGSLSYIKRANNQLPGQYFRNDIPIQTPQGLYMVPNGYSMPSYGGFTKSVKKVYFYSIFDKDTFEHLGEKDFSEENSEELNYSMNKQDNHLNVALVTESVVVSGYLDKELNQFIIVSYRNGN